MNISKIAALAQVSPATVSRYLNNGYVSNEKKERIRAVIEKTGYTPMASAQTLRTKRNHLIGVIVPKISSESVSRMVDGITEALFGTNYQIILANTDNTIEKEINFLQIFSHNTVDGVIFIATAIGRRHREILKTYHKPLVVLSQQEKGRPSVFFDDYGAAYAAAEHLVKQGCNSLACLCVMQADKAAGKARLEGFCDAAKKHGAQVDKRLICSVDFSVADGEAGIKKLLKTKLPFDGLFCATDNIAYGAVKALAKAGVAVPEAVKVCAVGDNKMSALFTPSLTSVHHHYKTGGIESGKLLLELLEGGAATVVKQMKLGFSLVERDSTQSRLV